MVRSRQRPTQRPAETRLHQRLIGEAIANPLVRLGQHLGDRQVVRPAPIRISGGQQFFEESADRVGRRGRFLRLGRSKFSPRGGRTGAVAGVDDAPTGVGKRGDQEQGNRRAVGDPPAMPPGPPPQQIGRRRWPGEDHLQVAVERWAERPRPPGGQGGDPLAHPNVGRAGVGVDRRAVDELHREVWTAIGLAQFEQAGDVWVRQLRRQLRLSLQASAGGGRGVAMPGQQLQCYALRQGGGSGGVESAS